MSSRRDALISALASGSRIDWRLLEETYWGEPPVAVPAVSGRSWLPRTLEFAWMLVLCCAAVQLAVALGGAPAAFARPGGSEPGWLLLCNVVLFGLSGAVFVTGGRQDRRLRALGGLFLLIAAAFAHPFANRGADARSLGLALFMSMPTDAFLATALWLFVWMFPQPPREALARRIGTIFIVGSAAIGAVLLAANVAHAAILVGGAQRVDWLPLLARTSGTLYWPLAFVPALPAIPYLLWRSRLEARAERQQVGVLLAAVGVGILPIVLAVFASTFVPAVGRAPWRDLIGIVVYAGLASMVPTAAHAVLIDHVMRLRLAVERSAQHTFARYAIWVVAVGPLTYIALDLYRHRDLTLSSYMDGGGPTGLFAMLFVGFSALTFRYQMLRGVDRWFRRDRPDMAQAMAGLDQALKASRTIRDAAGSLAHGIEAALAPSTLVVLVLDEPGERFVSCIGSAPPLPADSVLADFVRSAHGGVNIALAPASAVLPLLFPADRSWIDETGARLLAPLRGSAGALLGIVVLGEGQSGLPYDEHDHATLASMCGHTAMHLENQWLRQQPARLGRAAGLDARVDWQNEPAQICERCNRVWPPERARCQCGSLLARAALPLLLGGKFQVEQRLGAGGMGVVYLATDVVLGRKVALKTIPRLNDTLAGRLQHEARAMAKVLHPNLALIYGAEQWGGSPILIVEYLEGGTALDGLRRGPFTLHETLGLGIVLSDVLDRLHTSGILHRDVKPSNIGYTASGQPKLLDLGLAAMFDAAERLEAPASPGRADTLAADSGGCGTQSGHLGTLRYMSPEAVAGGAPVPGFDIWGLSVVLYEALSGRHPFAELSAEATIDHVRQGRFPDIRDSVPGCPPAFAALLRDSLSTEPSRRPATAAQLRRELQQLQTALRAQ